MEQSGAMLAWEYFHPDEDVPWIVKYVQDRDLWLFNLSESRAINAAISSWPRDFGGWNDALDEGEVMAAGDGAAILRYVDQYTEEMCAQARLVEFAGHKIYCVNAPYKGISEICGQLAEGAAFSMGWSQRHDGKYQYNLRSRGDFDVSALAREYGGGGHKASAGFVQDEPLDL
jgi:oligoribonuclease NrnB/cAMP/cGMP phosphodiesterase (DHH superfamily)